MEALMRNFLWSGADMKHTGAKIAWEQVCKPYKEGGLNIKSTKTWNNAAIGKHLWDIITKRERSYWVRWVHTHLIRGRAIWRLTSPRNSSWIWRKLLSLKETFRPFIKHKVGNGATTFLWYDHWLPTGPILPRMNERIMYEAALHRDAKVADIIVQNSWIWPSPQGHYMRDIVHLTDHLPSPDDCPDSVEWIADSSGKYTVSSAWNIIRDSSPDQVWTHLCWFKLFIPRFSFILWIAAHGRLSTCDRMARWGVQTATSCSLCGQALETHSHLFCSCSFIRQIWDYFDFQPLSSWQDWLLDLTASWRSGNVRNNTMKLCFSAIIYHVWTKRNCRIFRGTRTSAFVVIRRIAHTVRTRLMAKDVLTSHHITDLVRKWCIV